MVARRPEFYHNDSRRILTQLVTTPISQVNEYEVKKGAILGEHYHKQTYETFYVTKGAFMVNVNENRFLASRGTIFTVEPNETHTIEAISEDAKVMTFLSKSYTTEEPDTWKKES